MAGGAPLRQSSPRSLAPAGLVPTQLLLLLPLIRAPSLPLAQLLCLPAGPNKSATPLISSSHRSPGGTRSLGDGDSQRSSSPLSRGRGRSVAAQSHSCSPAPQQERASPGWKSKCILALNQLFPAVAETAFIWKPLLLANELFCGACQLLTKFGLAASRSCVSQTSFPSPAVAGGWQHCPGASTAACPGMGNSQSCLPPAPVTRGGAGGASGWAHISSTRCY